MQPDHSQTRLSARRAARGFGAIEMMVAVVILGMAFLFALKGRALLAPARAFLTIQQINQYKAAFSNYILEYKAIPGDDAAAPGRWRRQPSLYILPLSPQPVSFAGDGRIRGPFDESQSPLGEQFMVWSDLRNAGLIPGDGSLVGQSARPENVFGGVFGFAEDNLGMDQVLCLGQVPGTDAQIIDKRLDDDSISTGEIRATSQWDPVGVMNRFAQPDTAAYDPEKTYLICLPVTP